jgi:hypothetical protein
MHHDSKHQPIAGPVGWTGAQLRQHTDWIRTFTADELAEIDHAVQGVKSRGLDLVDVSPDTFPLPRLRPALAAIADELEHGRGMIMLRGLPLAYSPEDLNIAYWGLGVYLGIPVAQSPRGEFLQDVKDYGETVELTKSRGSRTTRLLPFHADRCDVVGLLCVRPSKSGGASRVVSAAAIHNAILARRPDLIDVFYDSFYQSRQGEEPDGQAPYFAQPIFSFHDGRFTGQFSPAYIRYGQMIPGCPKLTARQEEALGLFGQLSDELCLDMDFRPGDIQLLNNHTIYHARTAFDDYPEPERKRLLLRLWLSMPNSRPLPPGYEITWGSIEAGAIRGGIIPRTGAARDLVSERERRRSAR